MTVDNERIRIIYFTEVLLNIREHIQLLRFKPDDYIVAN